MAKKRKKKIRNKKYSGPKTPTQPSSFKKFEDCVKQAKKSVYLIARGRIVQKDGKENINWTTIGTGFIAAPKKFVTASHVISDPTKGELQQHKEGDKYYLIKHDDEDNWHFRFWEPKLDEDLFLYPDIDLAIINLEDAFYQSEEQIFLDRDIFLRINQDFKTVGSDIGVLGYPLCQLQFENQDLAKPNIGNVLLRCDKGVINSRYKTSEKHYLYEFTLAFNPGNSGGPIFDVNTGRLISIVRGFKSIPINIKEIELTEKLKKEIPISKYSEESYLAVTQASYSIGFATPSFAEVFKKHKIIQ